MHTKNDFFSIKIERGRQKIEPKSLNSTSPGGLRVKIFLPAKFSEEKNNNEKKNWTCGPPNPMLSLKNL